MGIGGANQHSMGLMKPKEAPARDKCRDSPSPPELAARH